MRRLLRKFMYRLYLLLPRWRIIRAVRRAIDGQRCVRCGSRKRLEVHHKTYRNKGRGIGIGELFDCVTLCRRCHRKAHSSNGGLRKGK